MAHSFIPVARKADVPEGGMKAVQASGKRLIVCRAGERFHVVDDTCTHDDGPLADGFLEGAAIECPRHGARFDITDGRVLCLPAAVGIRSYPVRVEGEQILADLG
jgi:nitrite reductase/ring-hydroxylating ferredoxin subunit